MIILQRLSNTINIKVQADLINTCSSAFDLSALQRAIIFQLKNVFHTSVGRYSVDINTNLHVLQNKNQCSPKNVLFQVVDDIQGRNPAEADFKGLRIKLNKLVVNDIITSKNIRTIPHEMGHLFGWDHPHARAKYESINPEAHPLEQQLTEDERKHNLMSQGWYAQRARVPLEQAMQISEKQIELLLLNYAGQKLNRNFHLKSFLIWNKLLN